MILEKSNLVPFLFLSRQVNRRIRDKFFVFYSVIFLLEKFIAHQHFSQKFFVLKPHLLFVKLSFQRFWKVASDHD